jgi:hypothetical protein
VENKDGLKNKEDSIILGKNYGGYLDITLHYLKKLPNKIYISWEIIGDKK